MAHKDNATITTQPLKENNNFQEEPKQCDISKVPDSDVVTMQPMVAQDPLSDEGTPKQADIKSRTHFCDVCLPLMECCADCSDIFCFWMCCKITHSNHHHYHEANGGGCCDECCKCDNCCDCGDCDCGDCDCGNCDCGDCDCGACDCDCL